MEAKANKMLDEANAMAELNSSQEDTNIDNLLLASASLPAVSAFSAYDCILLICSFCRGGFYGYFNKI